MNPSPAPEISANAQAAMAMLASAADLHDKARACQQLAIVGGSDAIPLLAALLTDRQLSDYARCALEAITAPAVGAALRNALPTLNGRCLAGVIDSLGVRRDVAAVPALQDLVRDPARGAATEALAALGKIASPEALITIRGTLTGNTADLHVPAAHAALVAAEHLAAQGKLPAARGLLESVATARVPAYLRAAAH